MLSAGGARVLTRAAAAAVGQAVTPALLQLLLPVMADEIVIGAASVPDPPFVVEDPSYRKVCRHTVGCAARCVRLSFSKPSTSQAFSTSTAKQPIAPAPPAEKAHAHANAYRRTGRRRSR